MTLSFLFSRSFLHQSQGGKSYWIEAVFWKTWTGASRTCRWTWGLEFFQDTWWKPSKSPLRETQEQEEIGMELVLLAEITIWNLSFNVLFHLKPVKILPQVCLNFRSSSVSSKRGIEKELSLGVNGEPKDDGDHGTRLVHLLKRQRRTCKCF